MKCNISDLDQRDDCPWEADCLIKVIDSGGSEKRTVICHDDLPWCLTLYNCYILDLV